MPNDDIALLRTDTAIVAKNVLARAGIHSLLEKYVYRVLGTAETVEMLSQLPLSSSPRLILIAAEAVDDLTSQASLCRSHWPQSRIVAIYDCRDPAEHEHVRGLAVNGCISTHVSERALLSLLDLLARDDDDIFFMLQLRPGTDHGKTVQAASPLSGNFIHGTNGGPSATLPNRTGSAAASNATACDAPIGAIHSGASMRDDHNCAKSNGTTYPHPDDVPVVPAEPKPPRNVPKLSDRELQILDGIVRGLQNKVIARTYGITEATVKVHMKSILRKIQVQNRTQAAVWAMGQDVSICSALEDRLFAADADRSLQDD
jgi:two-component system nitrate/nitrite response regulator NarL